jgi:DNA-binding GntR family transcriptional regulator
MEEVMSVPRPELAYAATAYQSKADIAYGSLRQQILDGSIAPSATINQEALAADLGVSTTPLREALRRLETEGFVQMRAHREVVVAPVDIDEMLALYQAREELDVLSARLAAKRHDDDDRANITRATERLSEEDAGDPLVLNRLFHVAIYRASHNVVLIEVLESLWDRADRYRRLIPLGAHNQDVTEEHIELSRAVLARRSSHAASLMRAHVRSAREAIVHEVSARRLGH